MKVKILFVFLLLFVIGAQAQTTEFSYQGRLLDNSLPPTAAYDFEFRLFAVDTGGTAISTIQRAGVQVANGIFTVKLDFGANFNGAARFLEIAVKPAGSPNQFTVLSPRQAFTSAPYSIRSLNSTTADTSTNSTQLGGIAANQFVQTSDSRLSDDRNPLPNSPNYINNTTVQQSSSNFNISGNGTLGGNLTANAVTSATQFNIGVNRVLALGTSSSIFVGRLAGASNTTGSGNTFVGDSAGRFNTTTSNNSFFGREAGTLNTANDNSFFGAFSGNSNTTGARNSFFGVSTGDNNVSGNDNSLFGYRAGRLNTASFNSFFGSGAGDSNTTGANNSFFGYNAGQTNSAGANNAFFGYQAGNSNNSNNNSFFGSGAGASNTTGGGNSFFGYLSGTSNTNGTQNSFFGRSAGSSVTTGSSNSFFGFNAGLVTTDGLGNSFFGDRSGLSNTTGNSNTFLGDLSGNQNSTGGRNVFIGSTAGASNTTGSNNTAIGYFASVGSQFSFATAIGAQAVAGSSNSIKLGREGGFDTVRIPGDLVVSQGSTFLFATFESNVNINGSTSLDGSVFINSLGSFGITDICLSSSNRIATCSSSLRYKTNVQTFNSGLDIVRRLRPITFNWKEVGTTDVGFAAEEVNQIEPLLTTRNSTGEIEGVKYAQITTVLVNAVNEQQTEIEQLKEQIKLQREQLKQQQQQTDALKRLVCQQNPQAEVCKDKEQQK